MAKRPCAVRASADRGTHQLGKPPRRCNATHGLDADGDEMSEDRQHVDAITAERLIRSARGGSPVGSELLANLLAAAAYPPDRGELAGEKAAVLAFRAARLASTTPDPRRTPMLRTGLAKLATAKVAIVLAAV